MKVIHAGGKLPIPISPLEELFVVGDVHGCADELYWLLQYAATIQRTKKKRKIVFLGDLMDRGPENLRVLDLVLQSKKITNSDELVLLSGNHDIMCRMCLDPNTKERDLWDAWGTWTHSHTGGLETLKQLGGPKPSDPHSFQYALTVMGDKRWALMCSAKNYYKSGSVLFVHGGVDPRAVATDSLEGFLELPWNWPFSAVRHYEHWAWIREPFLSFKPKENEGHGGYFVVHGHTTPWHDPVKTTVEQIRQWRLNLDSGCYRSGMLSMAHMCLDKFELYITTPEDL